MKVFLSLCYQALLVLLQAEFQRWPYKENYCSNGFGAVSIWVKDYVDNSTKVDDIVFCRKITNVKNSIYDFKKFSNMKKKKNAKNAKKSVKLYGMSLF